MRRKLSIGQTQGRPKTISKKPLVSASGCQYERFCIEATGRKDESFLVLYLVEVRAGSVASLSRIESERPQEVKILYRPPSLN